MTLRIYCPSCSAEIRNDSGICSTCGVTLNQSLEDDATRRLDSAKPSSGKSSLRTPSFDSIDNARFVPGAILAERYRIVGLLGKGGMGEVYRADDLKLGQAVALKFLPEHLLANGVALARFHREVRVARQVSHKNVCRVYDIGETDGRHFLSMEYIKGEELSSLLRRIGRLPFDKAIQLARQICAGLAAAHDAGVLHRDLKPANVMIDGDGNARVLDFGLAGLSEEFGEDERAAGTPAYMAPEQLEGKPFTPRSDIYSLGLVLYELFTGKRAFDAPSLHELIKLRRSDTTPTTPTSIVKDLDPLIEKVIDRCLQRDPEKRPSSALQVAAALPGGDPIAAALAAGETPSPEMVAAAPKEGALRPVVAVSMLAAIVVGLAIMVLLANKVILHGYAPLNKSPDVLRENAQEIIRTAGVVTPAGDSNYGFVVDSQPLDHIANTDTRPNRWEDLKDGQPAVIIYWYRQSPSYLGGFDLFRDPWINPPPIVSGMTGVKLDTCGRLLEFYTVPPEVDPVPRRCPPPFQVQSPAKRFRVQSFAFRVLSQTQV
jgi:predicted Ser/Thr protein kinase